MKSIKYILIIKGSSQYDVLGSVCDEFSRAFSNMGYVVSMINLGKFRYDLYSTELFSAYDMIISFDGAGIELYNQMSVKPIFWMFFVDHPFYINDRLKQIDGEIIVSCVDRRHVSYIDKYYNEVPWTCFMPHGGLTGDILSPLPYSERIYDVSLIASLGDIESINPLIRSLQDEYDVVSTPVIEKAILDIDADLENLVYDRLTELEIDFDIKMFRELMFVFRPIDALRRYYKRSSLINSLCENGITINIWGNGWEKYIKHNNLEDRIKLHKSASYNEAKSIMRKSRIVLNDMPFFHDGSHERVFAAIQSGSIVATDRSIFLEECFSDAENIMFYNTKRTDELCERIREILGDSKKAQRIIDNGLIVSQDHTWQIRASAMLQIVESLN